MTSAFAVSTLSAGPSRRPQLMEFAATSRIADPDTAFSVRRRSRRWWIATVVRSADRGTRSGRIRCSWSLQHAPEPLATHGPVAGSRVPVLRAIGLSPPRVQVSHVRTGLGHRRRRRATLRRLPARRWSVAGVEQRTPTAALGGGGRLSWRNRDMSETCPPLHRVCGWGSSFISFRSR